MALNTFGWTPAEVTQDSAGNVVPGVTLTVFTDVTKATQVTALFDKDGTTPLASGVVVSDNKGRFGFKVSDAYSMLYVYDGSTADPWPIAAHEALDGSGLKNTFLSKGNGEAAPTLQPLYIETLTTGLIHTSPDNLRTGLASTTYAPGGYTDELSIAVTGTKGSKVLTSTDTAKVAGLGANKFEAVINAADGSNDCFVTVMSNNGSNQITLRKALTADFAGTLSAKYNDASGQHLTQNATKAYAQHALGKSGVTGSRGKILDGAWHARPITYQTAWAKNAALTSYGVSNSAAPIVQSNIITSATVNVISAVDGFAIAPTALVGSIWCGTHTTGHGADATLYPRRADVVVEFYTGTYRSGATTATAQVRTVVTADGATVYDQTTDAQLTRVAVPISGADKVVVSVTNADGGIYYLLLSQLTMREAGIAGTSKSPLRKIVTLGDSWFAYYDGAFAKALAAKSGATVISHGLGGMTSDWGLSWFDEYVAKEKPDECWIHFFTNDSNNLTGTFTAPDGSTPLLWPAGLTSAQSQARWRANLLLLAQKCRALGIKPVIFLPGGTASQVQTQKHAEWFANFDQPAPINGWPASTAELADATAYINTVGKGKGASVLVGSSTKTAQGPLPADAWKNLSEDSLQPLQKKTLTLSSYQVATGVAIGTDTNADGLSDGLGYANYGTITGDVYTPSIVGGNQRYVAAYAASGASGNQPLKVTWSATAGKDYLVAVDVINGTASTAMGDSYSDLTGSNVVFTANGSTTIDASGAGVICYRATSSTTATKMARFGMLRSNGNTRTFDVRRAVVVDVAALLVDAPNMANATALELAQFALAIKP